MNKIGWIVCRDRLGEYPSYLKSDDGFVHFSLDVRNVKIFEKFLDATRTRDKLVFPKKAFVEYFNNFTIHGRY